MGPNHVVPILSPLEKTGTTLPPSAHQAQENSTQASTASQKQQSRNKPGPQNAEKMYFKTLKTHHQNSQYVIVVVGFFFLRDTLSCLFTIPLHSATAQVSPRHPTCCQPLPHTSTIPSQLVGANQPTNKHLSSCS